MSGNYLESIAEASYKNLIHNVPNTDTNLAWYEEGGIVKPHIGSDNVWLDSSYIPENPESVAYTDNTYYATINKSQVAIMKKLTIALTAVANTRAVYYNSALVDIIMGDKYPVLLYDSTGEQVPFGLNKWSVDSSNGYLSFLDGEPSGFTAPYTVTFYKYIGRTITTGMLTNDGANKMLADYSPAENQDIATKAYVDSTVKAVDNTVEKMVPPIPATFEGADIEFTCDKAFSAYYVKSGDKYDNVVLPDYQFTVGIPKFYNPGYGTVTLFLGVNGSYYDYKSIDLANIDTSVFTITYNGDAYADSLASRGFYNALKLQFDTSISGISSFYTSSPLLTFKYTYKYNNQTYSSKELTIGLEGTQVANSFSMGGHFVMATGTGYSAHYISGVNTPDAGAKLNLSGLNYETLLSFKSNRKISDVAMLGETADNLPDNSYSTVDPLLTFNNDFSVPDSYYTDSVKVSANTYNIFSENNGTHEESYNFHIDTVSDESKRVVSGTEGDTGDITGFGGDWDSTKDLTNSNELQMLDGLYQWPTQDFSINGQNISTVNQFVHDYIIVGPDYSKCAKTGTRYVTFKHELNLSNGAYITVNSPLNLTQDSDTKAFNLDSLRIKVVGATEWLNALSPYDGIGTVSELNQGCLAVQNCSEGTIYCTFGPKPIKGTLYIRIGIPYSRIKFSGVTVIENI